MIVNRIKGVELADPEKMKMNQIAYYCATAGAEDRLKKSLGLVEADWVKDTVYADVIVRGLKGKNVAQLQFNYDLGCELEIIRYVDGPHWMQGITSSEPFMAHIGVHLSEGQDWPAQPWELVQIAETYRHTAQHLLTGYAAGRLYSYRIHEISKHTFIKFIKRRNPK